MIEALTELLARMATALLVPDVVLLLLLAGLALVSFGGFLAEACERRRHAPAFRRVVRAVEDGAEARAVSLDSLARFGLPGRFLAAAGRPGQKLLADLEIEAERQLGRLVLGIRLGPLLGLAGTLIPLGPAMLALSAGDLDTLSQRLMVAFATSVLGLFVSGLCFAMHAVRRRWYTQDLADIGFLVERREAAA